jgi:hypothetical protein
MTRRHGAVAVVTFLVATTTALWVTAAHADEGDEGCAGVTVVVDANELAGDLRSVCTPDAGTASELFVSAGFPLEYQPQLQDFVCRVDGLPTDRRCTDGDSYWSLWWAPPGGDWAYSTLGVSSLEVPAGGWLGFAWHEGEGDATPPDVEVGAADASVEGPDPAEGSAGAEDEGGLSFWLAGGLAVLVLGAAGLVTVLRRRTG